jgi:hypothetical protein
MGVFHFSIGFRNSSNNISPGWVGTRLVGILTIFLSGYSIPEILEAYPYLEAEDIREALTYAAWRVEEIELPLASV